MVKGVRLWTMQKHMTKTLEKKLGAIPSAKAENPHQQQQQHMYKLSALREMGLGFDDEFTSSRSA